MNKTLALLVDSYRELNAKRLFWIVLALNAFVVGVFATIGIKNDDITILWWHTPLHAEVLAYISPATVYKDLFSYFGVGYWLCCLGNLLALISTAGIFPDFMAAGSIDLYLSKPISRLRLFLTKYIGGLMFVTMQVAIFSFCSFLVLGTRGQAWRPSIFLSIPLVVLVFSYLFSICVLLGVLTRSTIAALLVTLLLWFFLWGAQNIELALLRECIRNDVQTAALDRQIKQAKTELDSPNVVPADNGTDQVATVPATTKPSRFPFSFLFPKNTARQDVQARLERLETERAGITQTAEIAHNVAVAVLTPLPKTAATSALLVRALTDPDDATLAAALTEDRPNRPGRPERRVSFADRQLITKRYDAALADRSALRTLGTSIGFEIVLLGFAAWLFCRRDY